MAPIPTEFHQRSVPQSLPKSEISDTITPPEDIAKDRKLVGIDGFWYDVTNFVDKHPGGPVIEHFVGQDATSVFYAYGHSELLLKHRKPIGTYKRIHETPLDKDLEQLGRDFKKEGFFETDWGFYNKKFILCAILWIAAFYLIAECKEWYWHYLAAAVLASFWEQSGFLMHDLMHLQVFRNKFIDELVGTFFGTVCFGPSAQWWKDDHSLHHSLTNTVNVEKQFVDPQAFETVWAQNPKMFPFYGGILQSFLIKIQHITFLPMVVIFGRPGVLLDSYIPERRWHQWVAIFLHWTWFLFFLSFLPTWRELIVFLILSSTLVGSLHIKLLISHYSKEFLLDKEFHTSSWFEHQIKATINIDNVPWMDWFFGGLNLHIEHHLFPRMARSKYRAASPRIRKICEKHGLVYDSMTFFQAIAATLRGLKKSSVHYSLDPR